MTIYLVFLKKISNLNSIGRKCFCVFYFCVNSPYLDLNCSILVPTTLGSAFFFDFGFNECIDWVYLTEEFYVWIDLEE